MEKSPLLLIKRVGRASSLSSINAVSPSKTPVQPIPIAEPRKRSNSEPWTNTWDADIWARRKAVGKDEANVKVESIGFNIPHGEELTKPISKADAIKLLRSDKNKLISRRASIVGGMIEPKDVAKVGPKERHMKRMSMNSAAKSIRRSKILKPKGHMNLKYNLKHVDAIINFVVDHHDDLQLIEALALIDSTVAPPYTILESACKTFKEYNVNHVKDHRYDSIKTGLINYIGKRIALLPLQFASDTDSIHTFRLFLRTLEQSSDPLDAYFYDSLKKVFDNAMQLSTYEEEVIPSSLILELAKSNNIKPLDNILENTLGLCKPILGKKLISHLATQHKAKDSINVLYISPIELARQWTLIDHEIMKRLSIDDIIQNVKHPNRSIVLSEIADRFNHSTSWIATQILRVENSKKRSVVLAHFIEVAHHLLELNNYQGFVSFMMGLVQVPVSRLVSTWKKLPSRSMKTFHKLEKIANPTFMEIRKLCEEAEPPLVAAPSVFLRDMLVFLELNGSDFVEQNIIKSDIVAVCYKILLPIVRSQSTNFPFYSIPMIQNFLESGMILEFEELDLMSRRLEPGKEL